MVAYVRLPIDVRGAAAARRALQQALRLYGTETRSVIGTRTAGNAALLISELVTNAIHHTRGLLLLEITIRTDTLHVAVVDDAPEPPVLHNPDHDDISGRGLVIVGTLADRWGYTLGSGCKTVWFDLALFSVRDET